MNIQDEGKFDPKSIPLKSWNDYVSCIAAPIRLPAHNRFN
jgi:hypothetical protein